MIRRSDTKRLLTFRHDGPKNMKERFGHTIMLAALMIGLAAESHAQKISVAPTITIAADNVKAKMSPTLYGLMTEEINFSYEGGLYGELLRNRILRDDARGPRYWSVVQDSGGTG